jgi:hypothetical protein
MHGPPDFWLVVAWHLVCVAAALFYLALGQRPILTKALIVGMAAFIAISLVYLLREIPFGSGPIRFLIMTALASIPPLSFGLAWLLFRRHRG